MENRIRRGHRLLVAHASLCLFLLAAEAQIRLHQHHQPLFHLLLLSVSELFNATTRTKRSPCAMLDERVGLRPVLPRQLHPYLLERLHPEYF